jgi:hypothetical protein
MDDETTRIPVFSKICKVTVIDKTIPATTAQKTFVNNKIPGMEMFTKYKDEKIDDHILPNPVEEIKSYISTFARK